MNKKKTLFLGVFLVVVLTVVFFSSSEKNGEGEISVKVSEKFANIDLSTEPRGSVFQGFVTDTQVDPGVIKGVGVYDRSCIDIGGGLTRCDGGIDTDEYGLLNFNYTHNMHIDPCISPGELFTVEIINESGSAVVRRF